MRLDKLKLSNFRCFKSLEIDFHRELTVLVAPNGNGKTTILDAARVALWPFVNGFDLGRRTGKGASIQIADVRMEQQTNGNMEPQLPSSIEASGAWADQLPGRTWVRTRERVKPGTNALVDGATINLASFAEVLQKQVRGGKEAVTLPLVSYLGTSRLWYEGRFTSIAKDIALNTGSYSRTSGYLNCLSNSSSFQTFTAWYGWVFRSYREEQIKALESKAPLSDIGSRFAVTIEVIKGAINALVHEATGWHDLEYKASQNQQLVMHHDEFGIMPVDMLSDGLRNAIALVADLAFRACKLNPHLGTEAARRTPGVALIDEVDMFLHPSWQQTIIASLRQAFPRLQLIVTTHSPQVLTTVRRENIRLLGRDSEGGWQAVPPDQEIKGVESAVALNDAMKVNPIPPVAEARWLEDYIALIEEGAHETPDALKLREQLVGLYGASHPIILDADRLIRFQSFKLRAGKQG